MAWIESHQTLQLHPKTQKLSRKFNISIPAVIGHLHCLWWWALNYAEDGDLSKFDDEDIAIGALWEGDGCEFVQAIADVGFLDEDRRLHDWDDYAGRLLDQRAASKKRSRMWREQQRDTPQPAVDTKEAPERVTNAYEPVCNTSPTGTERVRTHTQRVRTRNEHVRDALPDLTGPNKTEEKIREEEGVNSQVDSQREQCGEARPPPQPPPQGEPPDLYQFAEMLRNECDPVPKPVILTANTLAVVQSKYEGVDLLSAGAKFVAWWNNKKPRDRPLLPENRVLDWLKDEFQRGKHNGRLQGNRRGRTLDDELGVAAGREERLASARRAGWTNVE